MPIVTERSARSRATCWTSTGSRRWSWPATRRRRPPSTCCGREHPALPVVGVEPALKPAVALSRTGHIAVHGDARHRWTAASSRRCTLRSPARRSSTSCPATAWRAPSSAPTAPRSRRCASATLAAAGSFGSEPGQIDTLVLGCTHYPFIADELRRHTGDAVRFIDTGAPVAQQTRRLLAQAGQLARKATAPCTLAQQRGARRAGRRRTRAGSHAGRLARRIADATSRRHRLTPAHAAAGSSPPSAGCLLRRRPRRLRHRPRGAHACQAAPEARARPRTRRVRALARLAGPLHRRAADAARSRPSRAPPQFDLDVLVVQQADNGNTERAKIVSRLFEAVGADRRRDAHQRDQGRHRALHAGRRCARLRRCASFARARRAPTPIRTKR